MNGRDRLAALANEMNCVGPESHLETERHYLVLGRGWTPYAELPEDIREAVDANPDWPSTTVSTWPATEGLTDPRDITIRTLKLKATVYAAAARQFLARLACFAVVVLLALPVFAAPKAPRHITRPLSTITVKVVAHEAYIRGQKGPLAHAAWRITTVDSDSCTVWVDTTAPDVSAEEVGALRACRKAIDGAVDAAADRSGV